MWMGAWWVGYPRLGPWLHARALGLIGATADYFFTYMGPELLLFGFGLIGIPLLYVLAIRLLPPVSQVLAVFLCTVAGSAAVYTDVVMIAREAERLCMTEAGIRVYRQVPPGSILGIRDPSRLVRLGVEAVEYTDRRGKVWRVNVSGKDTSTHEVAAIASSYEYRAALHLRFNRHFERDHLTLLDRKTGEVLAEAKGFRIFRGWADRLIDIGFHFRPPFCWQGKPDRRGGTGFSFPEDLVSAALLPTP
jgi:hypothetical protein